MTNRVRRCPRAYGRSQAESRRGSAYGHRRWVTVCRSAHVGSHPRELKRRREPVQECFVAVAGDQLDSGGQTVGRESGGEGHGGVTGYVEPALLH